AQRCHLRGYLHRVVADEPRVCRFVRTFPALQIRELVCGHADLPRATILLRLRTLGLERLVETGRVHRVSAFTGHELQQVDREAVGVVKAEGIASADRASNGGGTLRARRRRQLLEPRHALVYRREESLLFGARGVNEVLATR